MKRISAILILFLSFSLTSGAQNAELIKVLNELKTRRVSADYSCSIDLEGTTMHFKGKVTAQGECFHLIGNGTEIWCDGKSLLITDPAAKEAYIEPATTLARYIEAHRDSVRELEISKVSYSPASDDLREFIFPLEKLEKDWIITDLSK